MAKRNPFRTPRITRPGDGFGYPFLVLPLILLWLSSSWLAFDYGREIAGFDSGRAGEQMDKLRGELRTHFRERDQMERQIAALENEKKIHAVVQTEMQQTLKQLQNERLALEKKLLFLRGVSGGNPDQALLEVRDLKTWKDKTTDNYHLAFTINQTMNKQPSVKGEIQVSLKGTNAEKKEQVLKFVEIGQGEVGSTMKFKNFQKVHWLYQVPEGFVPGEWNFKLKSTIAKVKSYKENFPWQAKK